MRIAVIGKFKNLHDEEYIAQSFEMLGHTVSRFEQNDTEIAERINSSKFDFVLFTKYNYKKGMFNTKTVCWLFDIYWDYPRESMVQTSPFFKADYVITTDGGNEKDWKRLGINHHCVRQGIHKPQCFMEESKDPQGIVFIGADNPLFPERSIMMNQLKSKYQDFTWYGKNNTNAVRGKDLNTLYSKKKIVVGDSVYSPYYWSNRVVETLGRGGFLIHRYVEGIDKEYPHLVTYDGTMADLTKKIDYYLAHEDERREIVRKNFEWVRDNYTMEKKCQKILDYIS